MNISLELLFHYRCDKCDRWWSVADLMPVAPQVVCPHCRHINSVHSTGYVLPPMLSSDEIEALKEFLCEVVDAIEHSQESTIHEIKTFERKDKPDE